MASGAARRSALKSSYSPPSHRRCAGDPAQSGAWASFTFVDVRSLRSLNRREQDGDTRFARGEAAEQETLQPRTSRHGPHRFPRFSPCAASFSSLRRASARASSPDSWRRRWPRYRSALMSLNGPAPRLSRPPSSSPPPSARAPRPARRGLLSGRRAPRRSLAGFPNRRVGSCAASPHPHPGSSSGFTLFVIVSQYLQVPTREDRLARPRSAIPQMKRAPDILSGLVGVGVDPSSCPAGWPSARGPDCARPARHDPHHRRHCPVRHRMVDLRVGLIVRGLRRGHSPHAGRLVAPRSCPRASAQSSSTSSAALHHRLDDHKKMRRARAQVGAGAWLVIRALARTSAMSLQ